MLYLCQVDWTDSLYQCSACALWCTGVGMGYGIRLWRELCLLWDLPGFENNFLLWGVVLGCGICPGTGNCCCRWRKHPCSRLQSQAGWGFELPVLGEGVPVTAGDWSYTIFKVPPEPFCDSMILCWVRRWPAAVPPLLCVCRLERVPAGCQCHLRPRGAAPPPELPAQRRGHGQHAALPAGEQGWATPRAPGASRKLLVPSDPR